MTHFAQKYIRIQPAEATRIHKCVACHGHIFPGDTERKDAHDACVRIAAGDTREPQLVEIGVPAPLAPPVAESDILRYLDPEYSPSLMEESLSDEIPHAIS